jgi:hypothetical protein
MSLEAVTYEDPSDDLPLGGLNISRADRISRRHLNEMVRRRYNNSSIVGQRLRSNKEFKSHLNSCSEAQCFSSRRTFYSSFKLQYWSSPYWPPRVVVWHYQKVNSDIYQRFCVVLSSNIFKYSTKSSLRHMGYWSSLYSYLLRVGKLTEVLFCLATYPCGCPNSHFNTYLSLLFNEKNHDRELSIDLDIASLRYRAHSGARPTPEFRPCLLRLEERGGRGAWVGDHTRIMGLGCGSRHFLLDLTDYKTADMSRIKRRRGLAKQSNLGNF